MQRATEQIKDKLAIQEVISGYLSIERAGNNFKARCPFHQEKTPSFFISPDRGTYYCFGCGAKGDIFDFVEQVEGVDFKAALSLLADKAGVVIEQYQGSTDDKSKLYETLHTAMLFYHDELLKSPEALAYLLKRGVTENTIKEFRLGYAPDAWDTVLKFLRNKSIADSYIERAGLIKKGDQGKLYDRFRNRIMFPILDPSGRVVAFSGRTLDSKEEAKYINSPETELFIKSRVLFGLDKAKQVIRTQGYALLVEGQFDLILSHQAGIKNTVAVSGTAFTTSDSIDSLSHLGVIRRLTNNVKFAFDGDTAGRNAAWKASKAALALGMDIKIIFLPKGKDPADMILQNKEEYIECIKKAVRPMEFFSTLVVEESENERERIGKIKTFVIPLLHAVESPLQRSGEIRTVSRITGFKEEIIEQELTLFNKNTSTKKDSVLNKETQRVADQLSLVDRLFGIIFYLETKNEDITNYIKDLKDICGSDFDQKNEEAKIHKEELLYFIELVYPDIKFIRDDWTTLFRQAKIQNIKLKLKEITEKLRLVHQGEEHDTLLGDFQKYTKQLQDLI